MSICDNCEKVFICGLLEGDPAMACWCTQLPALPLHKLGLTSPRCYCPDCLLTLTNSVEAS